MQKPSYHMQYRAKIVTYFCNNLEVVANDIIKFAMQTCKFKTRCGPFIRFFLKKPTCFISVLDRLLASSFDYIHLIDFSIEERP